MTTLSLEELKERDETALAAAESRVAETANTIASLLERIRLICQESRGK